MQNAFKRFGAKATGSFNKRFHLSILKLTLMYVAILGIILFLSSSITYSAFSSRLQHRFELRPPIRQDLIDQNRMPRPEDVRGDLVTTLMIVNGLLLIGAGALSYLLAQLTLEPIKAAFERQRRFLSDASHELRTPLAILHTDVQNELADAAVTGRTRERAQSNLEEIERMNRLINDLLIISREDENGNIAPENKSVVNISKLIQEAMGRVQMLAQKHGVSVNFNPAADNLEIMTDPELLMQALVNLIKNAIIYNKANGTVNVSVQKEKNQAKIKITDTGIGISPEDLAKIFDRFYRVEKSRSRNTGGAGLGLPIVRASIEKLHGTIEIKSELEKSTTVTILLPLQ